MAYLNSITLVGFVGSDPEQRQAKGNGSKFTVLSVATQRSWKNADGEWSSKTEWHRVVVFRPLLASVSLRLSRRVLTYSSKAHSSARPTNNRTAKARSRRPRRLRRGQSAPMSCAGSTAVNQSPTRPLPRKHRSPTKLRSDVFCTKTLRRCRRALLFSRVNDQSAASIWISAVSRS
jgi:hypothetical protein